MLRLVEFDQQDMARKTQVSEDEQAVEREQLLLAPTEGQTTERHGKAIALLVDHTYSIPVSWGVSKS